jgi:hypothetical protein
VFLSAVGDRYDGEWVKDKKQGLGSFVWANGTEYDGEFEDNEPLGPAIYIEEGGGGDDPSAPSAKEGRGTYPNGDEYDGEWVKGKRHGRGVYTWANGDEYYGGWAHGRFHGKGVFTGEWVDGQPVVEQGEDVAPACEWAEEEGGNNT